jgi:rhodanese-related sulfurtransferase
MATPRRKDSRPRTAYLVRLWLSGLVATGAIALLAACSGGSTGVPSSPSPDAGAATIEPGSMAAEVSVAEAAALRDAGAFMLDVREPDEWAAGHIPGATLIPLGTLESRLNELPTDRDIVVVCRSGNRSAQGRDVLRANGLDRSTSMAGGMNDWVSAGRPTETGS